MNSVVISESLIPFNANSRNWTARSSYTHIVKPDSLKLFIIDIIQISSSVPPFFLP